MGNFRIGENKNRDGTAGADTVVSTVEDVLKPPDPPAGLLLEKIVNGPDLRLTGTNWLDQLVLL